MFFMCLAVDVGGNGQQKKQHDVHEVEVAEDGAMLDGSPSELCESIGSGLGSSADMETMRKILSLSYYDLPAHLKTCLLYLSIFPEDYRIKRDRLIWRWIAEDFVPPGEGGKSLFKLGESYFYELINRSLIQPADTDEEGMPAACRVHDMVLDLICSLSREECFVATILGDTKQDTHSGGSKVHRLSLQNTTWPTMELPKLRSLAIFSGDIINSMPSFSCYHLLRVLDLEDCSLKELTNLSFVAHLFHLRYLSLRNTDYAGELPSEIGNLQLLQTLDLRETNIKELPSSIVGLRRLMCLALNWIICLPNGLDNLTSLEVLEDATVDSVQIAEELGHLMQLRILTVGPPEMDREAGCDEGICKALVESISKLQKIRHLKLLSGSMVMNLEGSLESLGNLSYLFIDKTSLLPRWINPGSLPHLSSLDITVAQVRTEDIQVLGMLQALRFLKVSVSGGNLQLLGRFTVGPDAFPCARLCRFIGFRTVPSMFPRGAMPMLEDFLFHISLQDFLKGEFSTDDLALDHLSSLRSVDVRLYGGGHEKMEQELEMKEKVKEKLSQEADAHPNHPSLALYYLTKDPGFNVCLPECM